MKVNRSLLDRIEAKHLKLCELVQILAEDRFPKQSMTWYLIWRQVKNNYFMGGMIRGIGLMGKAWRDRENWAYLNGCRKM